MGIWPSWCSPLCISLPRPGFTELYPMLFRNRSAVSIFYHSCRIAPVSWCMIISRHCFCIALFLTSNQEWRYNQSAFRANGRHPPPPFSPLPQPFYAIRLQSVASFTLADCVHAAHEESVFLLHKEPLYWYISMCCCLSARSTSPRNVIGFIQDTSSIFSFIQFRIILIRNPKLCRLQ